MWSTEKICLSMLAVALAMLIAIAPVNAAKELPALVKITTAKPDDSVVVEPAKPKTILLVVKSHSGSGRATINGLNEDCSKIVTLRFCLKGLEALQISNGTVSLNAAASLHDHDLEVRQWKSGEENDPLDDTDPLSMKVRIAGNDPNAQTSLPLKKGYFEVVLPKALFAGKPKSITVSWIDFYR
jgi:hypothetical protein